MVAVHGLAFDKCCPSTDMDGRLQEVAPVMDTLLHRFQWQWVSEMGSRPGGGHLFIDTRCTHMPPATSLLANGVCSASPHGPLEAMVIGEGTPGDQLQNHMHQSAQ